MRRARRQAPRDRPALSDAAHLAATLAAAQLGSRPASATNPARDARERAAAGARAALASADCAALPPPAVDVRGSSLERTPRRSFDHLYRTRDFSWEHVNAGPLQKERQKTSPVHTKRGARGVRVPSAVCRAPTSLSRTRSGDTMGYRKRGPPPPTTCRGSRSHVDGEGCITPKRQLLECLDPSITPRRRSCCGRCPSPRSSSRRPSSS